MVESPEKIWAIEKGYPSRYRVSCSVLEHGPDEATEYVRADLYAALEAQLAERVRVKPLVWKELPGNQHCNIAFTADTIGGSFVIEERAGDTFDLWRTAQEIARRFSTLDEAKAAAQDWHNNAVAEALEATAAPEQRELSAEDVATFDRALLRSGRKAEATPPAPMVTEVCGSCGYTAAPDCPICSPLAAAQEASR